MPSSGPSGIVSAIMGTVELWSQVDPLVKTLDALRFLGFISELRRIIDEVFNSWMSSGAIEISRQDTGCIMLQSMTEKLRGIVDELCNSWMSSGAIEISRQDTGCIHAPEHDRRALQPHG